MSINLEDIIELHVRKNWDAMTEKKAIDNSRVWAKIGIITSNLISGIALSIVAINYL